MTRLILLVAAALLLAACTAVPQAKRYAMEGDVKAIDSTKQTATIDAGKIGDWMEAMMMEYPVQPGAEFAKLKVGDHIKATMVVDGAKYYVTAITVAAKH
jgi:Cu/Ag efflux protein CusF